MSINHPPTCVRTNTHCHTAAQLMSAAVPCKLQYIVTALAEWGSTWRVQFKPSKSQGMTVSCHQPSWPVPVIAFAGSDVEEVSSLNLLGVTFDNCLLYGPHLQAVALTADQRIGFLRKASVVLDPPCRTSVDSLSLRRLLSSLCFMHKLLCGPHVPCLSSLLLPTANRHVNPRTRQQLQASISHQYQMLTT